MVILRWMLLLVGVLALAAPEVLADARESYRQGMDELENGRFAAAAEHFRAAINERGEERSSGTFRRAYLPHFQLGVALAEQGDCPGAMAAWEKSLRQGQVQNETDEYRQLERLRQRCERQRLDAAQLAAEQALARTTKAAQALEDLRRVSELATVWSEESSAEEPSFAAREAALAKRFEQAKASLAAARDAAAVEPWEDAKDLALEVAAGFDALAAAARERLLDLQDATASSLDRLQAMEGRAHTVLRRIADLEPYPEGLGARVEAVQDDLAEILRRKATAGPDDLVRLRRQLAVSVARLEEAAAPRRTACVWRSKHF